MSQAVIAEDEVHLWDTSLIVNEDDLERNELLLSPDEMRYAARFSDTRAKNQFIISRGKLRELLAGYAGQPPEDLRFGMTREGKPFLASAREFEFNLTHSADLVLYGVARSRPVGVDVERVREMPRAIELAKRFMSAEEHEQIASAPQETRDKDFLSLWVRREGSGKAFGVGVWKVLENGQRPGEPRAPNNLFAQITRDYSCESIDYSNDYVAAVAALGDDWRLVRRGSVSMTH
jgi:4'-phosphopantetheinyl transferase